MQAWGVDPSGHGIGLAHAVQTEPRAYKLSILTTIRISADTGTREWYAAVIACDPLRYAADAAFYSGEPIAIERPAETAKADVKHGHQAVVGFGIGRVVGAIATLCVLRSAPIVYEVAIADWRRVANGEILRVTQDPAMDLAAWLRAPGATSVPGPSRIGLEKLQRIAGHLMALYRCGHLGRISDVEDVFTGALAPQCPQCSHVPKGLDPAEYRRDRYKAWAVEAVRRLDPGAWAVLVADARSRATKEDKETRDPHKLAGVSDACEAALIAVSAIVKEGGGRV